MIIILSHPSIIISIVQVGRVEDLDAAFQTILDAASRQRARFCCQLRREEGCGLGLGQKLHALAFAWIRTEASCTCIRTEAYTRPRQHAGQGTNADTKQTIRRVDETTNKRHHHHTIADVACPTELRPGKVELRRIQIRRFRTLYISSKL